MTIRNVVSGTDGAGITVADFVKNPLFIPTRLKQLLANQFIAEALLRNAGSNVAGIYAYRESDPMFLVDDIDELAEFGEIPVSHTARGIPKIAFGTKRGKGVRVTYDMIRKNQVDDVNQQIRALVNTFIRANDRAAKLVLQADAVPTVPVPKAWDAIGGKPRKDIAEAISIVTSAAPTEAEGGSEDEYYGFVPDTIVLHPGLLATLMDNDDVLKVYQGNIADQNIAYTGALPAKINGLQVIQSRSWPIDRAFILERGTIGFYGDARPLQHTELYPEGNGPNGGPRETWRTDSTQERALGIDQPNAGLWLTGLVEEVGP
ncbi:hypothetical protein GS498_09765 [Rhodococcus hoagii]|nr:hypothetical protein [Prescottella equi]